MDKKKIIEEGLLERYLLGDISPEESELVAQFLKRDADLQDQLDMLEQDFERMAFENAVEPPEKVRKSLKSALEEESSAVKSLSSSEEKSTFQASRLLVAASLAALFALSSFWFYMRWQTGQEKLELLQQQTVNLQSRLDVLESNFEEVNNRYHQINNPEVIPLVLFGNQLLPDSKAIVYVNHQTKEVFVNSRGLPVLEGTKTYQMWADVEGEMIDMGVVPRDQEWIVLKYIDHAESLNITIEPEGGNDHPTVENLISNVLL